MATEETKEVTPQADEEMYAKLVEGKMSFDEVDGEQTTQEIDPVKNDIEAQQVEDVKPTAKETSPVEETFETYKAKSEKEIERLNKIAKDNQAEFTRRSQELSSTRAELEELKAKLKSYEEKESKSEMNLDAFEDYPDEIKNTMKAFGDKMAEMDSFVKEQRRNHQVASEQQKVAEQMRNEFQTNILPEIVKEVPDYESFMKDNLNRYSDWARTLSEGDRFSFLNSKDPRDLVRGYREFKKFLNLPYENEAINNKTKETEKTKTLYSSTGSNSRQVAPKVTPKLSEREAYEQFIKSQGEEWRNRRL